MLKNGSQFQKNFKEWVKAIVIAVFSATLVRWLTLENYVIPSSSMESSLMTGDYIVVSKLHYGARTPRTPLQVPLTHQHIWGTSIPSYSTAIQLTPHRLPGFSKVKRGDVVVFNTPVQLERPLDIREYWIKRCVGLPGDKINLIDGKLLVNDIAAPLYPALQYQYRVKLSFKEEVKLSDWHAYGVREAFPTAEGEYSIFTTPHIADFLSKLLGVTSVEPIIKPVGLADPTSCFSKRGLDWNTDQFGPLVIPKKGWQITINKDTLARYGDTILHYEPWSKETCVELGADTLRIDGKVVLSYTFKQDYYFMMGDNRHLSRDSRFFGFVPADHIVGKAILVLFSRNTEGKGFHIFRKGRFFKTDF